MLKSPFVAAPTRPPIRIQNRRGFGGLVVEVEGVPGDRGEVPLDGTEEGVLPIGPEQSRGGLHEIAEMGVAMQGLLGKGEQDLGRLLQMMMQHPTGRLIKGANDGGRVEQVDALVEDFQIGQFPGEGREDLVATSQGRADFGGIGLGLDFGDEDPEAHRVAEMLVRPGWHLRMERDDRSPLRREVQGDRVFAGKPLVALPRSLAIGDDPSDEIISESDDEGVAVLKDLAAVRGDTAALQGLDGGAERKFEAGGNHEWK